MILAFSFVQNVVLPCPEALCQPSLPLLEESIFLDKSFVLC